MLGDETWGDDIIEDIPEEASARWDPKVEEAVPVLEAHFQAQRQVFYLRQLQVMFEKKFFHWITAKAVRQLVAADRVKLEVQPLLPLGAGVVNFLFHPSVRYWRRDVNRKLGLIRRFSTEDVGRACGRQAEILFSRVLMMKGFTFVAENARAYGGQEWTETGHDLDFIFARDGIAYGCEIKNRFEYIERDELEIKMAMCHTLGLRPLFIVRAAPGSYIHTVQLAPGFTKVFVSHIYPFGYMDLVKAIKAEFDGMPVDSPRDLPATILDSFVAWHMAHPVAPAGGVPQ